MTSFSETRIRRFVSITALVLGVSALGSAAELQGVIADWNCVKPMVKNGREAVLRHNRNCSLMKNPSRGAYGLITDERKFYRLDDPGNRRILELLRNTPDKDNLKVIVSGELTGNTIKIENLSIL